MLRREKAQGQVQRTCQRYVRLEGPQAVGLILLSRNLVVIFQCERSGDRCCNGSGCSNTSDKHGSRDTDHDEWVLEGQGVQ